MQTFSNIFGTFERRKEHRKWNWRADEFVYVFNKTCMYSFKEENSPKFIWTVRGNSWDGGKFLNMNRKKQDKLKQLRNWDIYILTINIKGNPVKYTRQDCKNFC